MNEDEIILIVKCKEGMDTLFGVEVELPSDNFPCDDIITESNVSIPKSDIHFVCILQSIFEAYNKSVLDNEHEIEQNMARLLKMFNIVMNQYSPRTLNEDESFDDVEGFNS